jgi:hypothetical protein
MREMQVDAKQEFESMNITLVYANDPPLSQQ